MSSHTDYDVRVRAKDGFSGVSDWQTRSLAFTTMNHLPVVGLTSPAGGTLFTAPASMVLSASASDSDGSITKVEFFAGTTKLGEATSAPYSFTWQNAPYGSYSLTAKATDDLAGEATSAPVQIVVNERPTVSITSPTNGTVFVAPKTVTLLVNAADVDGTVAKMELFLGAAKMGESVAAPYQFVLPDMVPGEYSFTAVATDNLGANRTSDSVAVSIHSNDLFADRKRVSGASVVACWANTFATAEPGEPAHAGQPARNSLWWSWTAPANGTVTVSTYGSSFDTRLAIYTGSAVSALSSVAANDDDGELTTSRVCFGAVAGTEYQIAVDGYDGAIGDILLTLSQTPPGTVGITTATPIPNGTVGTSLTQKFDAVGDCGGFSWSLLSGALPSGLVLTSDGVLGGIPAVPGSYTFTLRATSAGSQIADKLFALQVNASAATPANDLFADAKVLTGAAASDNGLNLGASRETGEPDHVGSPAEHSVWWTWTAPFSGHVSFDTLGSDFDTRLAAYRGTALANLVQVAANDDAYPDYSSRVSFEVVSGTRYFIAVDGVSGETGTVHLTLLTGTGPANDNLADAHELFGSQDSATGNNTGATQESGEAAHTSPDDALPLN